EELIHADDVGGDAIHDRPDLTAGASMALFDGNSNSSLGLVSGNEGLVHVSVDFPGDVVGDMEDADLIRALVGAIARAGKESRTEHGDNRHQSPRLGAAGRTEKLHILSLVTQDSVNLKQTMLHSQV